MTAQLTYGCSDGIPGRSAGGWGVLHRSATLDPATEQRLVQLVSVDLPTTLPDFPGKQQLLERPVRFRVVADPEGGLLLARSIEAGLDHTRRPGNVFTHAARVDRAENVRALDYWWASEWLSPFGADQVRRAVPPPALTVPAPGPSGLGHALAAAPSLARVLPWFLDGALHFLLSGYAVCLIEPDPARAAVLARALSWTMDERSAVQYPVALQEDKRSVAQVLDAGYRFVSVAGEGVAGAQSSRAVVLDARWQLSAEDAAARGNWMTPGGLEFPHTDAGMVLNALLGLQGAPLADAVARREAIASGLRGFHALPAGAEGQANMLALAMWGTPQAEELGGLSALSHRLGKLSPLVLSAHPLLKQLAEIAGIPSAAAPASSPAPTVNLSGRRPVASAPWDAPAETAPVSAAEPTPEEPHDAPFAWDAGHAEEPASQPPAAATEASASTGIVPTPRTAAEAMGVLGRLGLAGAFSGSADAWVDSYTTADPEAREALVLAAVHAADPLSARGLATLLAATPVDPTFDRVAPALVVLACRSQLVDPPQAMQAGSAWSALTRHLGRAHADELSYLAFHFGPLLERLDRPDAGQARALPQLLERPTFSAWGLPCADGLPLAQVVVDEISRTQASVGPADPSLSQHSSLGSAHR